MDSASKHMVHHDWEGLVTETEVGGHIRMWNLSMYMHLHVCLCIGTEALVYAFLW